VRLARVLTQVDSVILGLRTMYRKQALIRLFSDDEVAVDRRTTAVSPGFAGSGTGLNAFSRPYPSGAALGGGYTHYYRAAAADRAATIKTARDQLRKWQSGPFDLIGSAAEITAIKLLSDFVPAGSALVRPGQSTAEALVDAELYEGVYDGDIRVRKPVEDFTDANFAIFKTFGPLNPLNPLAWRYDDVEGRNAYVRYRALFPLDQAIVRQSFGIGVNNRVAAALVHIDSSGSYDPPTIS
jgi:hypothetical protein